MDHELAQLIEEIPTAPPRSKLEPHAEVIAKLRRKRLTYKAIAAFFKANLQIDVAPSTIHFFVQRRSRKPRATDMPDEPQPAARPKEPAARVPITAPLSSPHADRARERIRAVRDEPAATEERPPRFAYDPEEPLSFNQPKEK